jgi:hypothetical protein
MVFRLLRYAVLAFIVLWVVKSCSVYTESGVSSLPTVPASGDVWPRIIASFLAGAHEAAWSTVEAVIWSCKIVARIAIAIWWFLGQAISWIFTVASRFEHFVANIQFIFRSPQHSAAMHPTNAAPVSIRSVQPVSAVAEPSSRLETVSPPTAPRVPAKTSTLMGRLLKGWAFCVEIEIPICLALWLFRLDRGLTLRTYYARHAAVAFRTHLFVYLVGIVFVFRGNFWPFIFWTIGFWFAAAFPIIMSALLFLLRIIDFPQFRKGNFREQKFDEGPNDRSGDRGNGEIDGRMSRSQALEILDLQEGASKEDMRAAYKRLMLQVHPDKGGSTHFAKQLNEARRMLGFAK